MLCLCWDDVLQVFFPLGLLHFLSDAGIQLDWVKCFINLRYREFCVVWSVSFIAHGPTFYMFYTLITPAAMRGHYD
ncbi:hypothetical protein DVH24_023750 [Malus domestica]|uniref:Uncharacterized protein n=1 Tax=Malus domestica TaxID=3750 RepID=A0A498I1K3_MALDO|nr:hypothetical protein DVH24_023750 [Malus domestica]